MSYWSRGELSAAASNGVNAPTRPGVDACSSAICLLRFTHPFLS